MKPSRQQVKKSLKLNKKKKSIPKKNITLIILPILLASTLTILIIELTRKKHSQTIANKIQLNSSLTESYSFIDLQSTLNFLSSQSNTTFNTALTNSIIKYTNSLKGMEWLNLDTSFRKLLDKRYSDINNDKYSNKPFTTTIIEHINILHLASSAYEYLIESDTHIEYKSDAILLFLYGEYYIKNISSLCYKLSLLANEEFNLIEKQMKKNLRLKELMDKYYKHLKQVSSELYTTTLTNVTLKMDSEYSFNIKQISNVEKVKKFIHLMYYYVYFFIFDIDEELNSGLHKDFKDFIIDLDEKETITDAKMGIIIDYVNQDCKEVIKDFETKLNGKEGVIDWNIGNEKCAERVSYIRQ